MSEQVRVKRVYDLPADEDGLRILVDRLWPRGVSRDKGRIDGWLKAVAPSDALRRQVHAEPDHGASAEGHARFAAAYRAELSGGETAAAAAELVDMIRAGPVTLLFAARGHDRNNATVLRDWLLERLD